LPSLWEAAFETNQLKVFTVGERGKRVLSGELEFVWMLMNRLAAERAACLGKHVSSRLALIAPDLVSSLYAQTGRVGTEDDFRHAGPLAPLELELAEALLEHGPRTGPQLRSILGGRNAKAAKSALTSLERQLIVTHADEQEQASGWDAAVYDLLARRYADELTAIPSVQEARATLAGRLLQSAGRLSAPELARVLGLPRREAATVLDGLVLEGRAEVDQSGTSRNWRSRASP
jgi:Winged helix DNA-binding domain